MAKIRLKDLPKNQKISKEEIRRVAGGANIIFRRMSIAPEKWIELKWTDIGRFKIF